MASRESCGPPFSARAPMPAFLRALKLALELIACKKTVIAPKNPKVSRVMLKLSRAKLVLVKSIARVNAHSKERVFFAHF